MVYGPLYWHPLGPCPGTPFDVQMARSIRFLRPFARPFDSFDLPEHPRLASRLASPGWLGG